MVATPAAMAVAQGLDVEAIRRGGAELAGQVPGA
jgi:hypothetical protein